MKNLIYLMAALLIPALVFSQDIEGDWNGLLKTPGVQLRLVLHITKTGTGFSSTMDSPDQGAKGIPVTETIFENNNLRFKVAAMVISYEGTLNKENIISGTFKQGGFTAPLDFSRKPVEAEKPKRPQEPIKPFPYYSEDIVFENKTAGNELAGTLTLPEKEGNFPAVVLISGSGPQNRDEELMGHKPFLVLSDFLTRNGIAVLRFDDRGVGASKGNFASATSADFSTDVNAAVNFLLTRKEINKNKIGLIGHSEGGIIAPMVAAEGNNIAYIILMAGIGIPGDQLLLSQQQAIAKASGASDIVIEKSTAINKIVFEMVKKSTSIDQVKTDLTNYLLKSTEDDAYKPAGMADSDFVKMEVERVANPWMYYFLRYDPAPVLQKVKCPVLALNGDKDLQVPSKVSLPAIKNEVLKGGNKNITIKELSNLNHLFQECKTGLPNEYASIEQTISPVALNEILQWINMQVKK